MGQPSRPRRGRIQDYFWLSMMLMVALATVVSTEGLQAEDEQTSEDTKACDSCHKIWTPPELVLTTPREIPVNSTFAIYGTVLNHGQPLKPEDRYDDGYPHKTGGVGLALDPGELALESLPLQELGQLVKGEDATASWSLATGSSETEETLIMELTGTAYFSHNTPQKDTYQFRQYMASESVIVRDVPLRVSAPLMVFTADKPSTYELLLWSEGETLENVTLGAVDSSEIDVNVAINEFRLEPGKPVTVSLDLSASQNITVLLPVQWVNEDGHVEIFNLTLASLPVPRSEQEDTFQLFGRTAGLLCLGLLVVSAISGGYPELRQYLDDVFSQRRLNRVQFHCWISLGLLLLGLFHGLHAVLGPYSSLGWQNWGLHLWLGWGALLLFGLLTLHGYYMIPYIRRRSPREWKIVHQRILTVAAVLVVALHAILVGTDKMLIYASLGVIGMVVLVVLSGAVTVVAARRSPWAGTDPSVGPVAAIIGSAEQEAERIEEITELEEAPMLGTFGVAAGTEFSQQVVFRCLSGCQNEFPGDRDDKEIFCPRCGTIGSPPEY